MIWLVLCVYGALLQVADFVTTYNALRNGGRELNPVVRWGIENLGLVAALIVYKGIGIALFAWLYTLHDDQSAQAVIVVLTLFYTAVIVNNLRHQ